MSAVTAFPNYGKRCYWVRLGRELSHLKVATCVPMDLGDRHLMDTSSYRECWDEAFGATRERIRRTSVQPYGADSRAAGSFRANPRVGRLGDIIN